MRYEDVVEIAAATCPVRVPASARGPSPWPMSARGSRSLMRSGGSERANPGPVGGSGELGRCVWWLHGLARPVGLLWPSPAACLSPCPAPRRTVPLRPARRSNQLRPYVPPFFAINRCTAPSSSLLSRRRSDILSINSVSTSLMSWAASRHFASLSLCKPMLRALCKARSGL
jgi:hypothetical protein